MRTTLTLDDDVAAMLEHERRRTGQSTRQVTNRILRRGLQRGAAIEREVVLPVLPGQPGVEITDVSAVLADDADEALASKDAF